MHGLAELAASLRRSSVQVRGRGPGGGSGVIWNSDGLVITNAHVVRGREVAVTLHDGRELRAEVTSRDSERDLAALRIQANRLPPPALGDSDKLRVGQVVVAVGNPLGAVGAVTAGIIHATGGNGWIQADVKLAPGNSGGILADAEGRVIGINTMIYQGLALAVPSNAVAEFLAGESTPRLGVELYPVEQGLLVVAVGRGSLAERAGVCIGDVLLASLGDLAQTMRTASKSGGVLRYVRAGKTRQLVFAAGALAA